MDNKFSPAVFIYIKKAVGNVYARPKPWILAELGRPSKPHVTLSLGVQRLEFRGLASLRLHFASPIDFQPSKVQFFRCHIGSTSLRNVEAVDDVKTTYRNQRRHSLGRKNRASH